jgi:hypothetical protein
MRRCIVEGVLAPTVEQRVEYKKWLHIYGKDVIFLSSQMAKLHKDYMVSYFCCL